MPDARPTRPPPPPPPVEVRRSTIHGEGLFATRAIACGEDILEYTGEVIGKAESARRQLARRADGREAGRVYLFELDARSDLDGDTPDNIAKYANHSCDENCEAVCEGRRIRIRAIRRIEAGEELTFDYAYGLAHFFEHPCRCGSPNCAGYIVAKPDRIRLRQWLARWRKTGRGAKGAPPAPHLAK